VIKIRKYLSVALACMLLLAVFQTASPPARAAGLTPPFGYTNIESTDFEDPATDVFGFAATQGLDSNAGVAAANVTTSVGAGADANATRKLSWSLSNTSGSRNALKAISASTQSALGAADEAMISFDWYPGNPSGGTSRGEIRLVNAAMAPIPLALVATQSLVGYYTGGSGADQTILPTGHTSRTQWYSVNIHLKKGSNVSFDMQPRNNAGSVSRITTEYVWTGALTSIQILGARLGSNITWATYIDNIAIYRYDPAPATFSAAANGDATTSTSQITLNLDTAVTGLAASNITLTPAGSATIGTPTTADDGRTWTVPVSDAVAGDVTVGLRDIPGYTFTASPAGADTLTFYAGATARYAVSADGSSAVTSAHVFITFDTDVTGLTADRITLSPAGMAAKGALSGDGRNWTLQLINAQNGAVTVTIGNIPNFVIVPHEPGVSDKAALFKRPPDVIRFGISADGDSDAKTPSAKIDITFDTDVTGLAADAIDLIPADSAVKGALTGGGKNWSLALAGVAATKEIRLSISDFADYTFLPLEEDADKTKIVYVKPDVAFTGSEWTTNSSTPFVFQLGGENPRSYYYLYDTEAKALDGFTLYPFADEAGTVSNSASILPLNGTWKFHFSANPGQRPWPAEGTGQAPRDFNTLDFDAGSWDDITVPNSWQVNFNADGTAKYDQAQYVNSTNPAWGRYLTGNGTSVPAAPTLYNGVGTYQRHFYVPDSWAGKEVFLNFDGVSACYVWINGRAAGWTTDIWTHHEFDVTPYIRAGDNVIALQIIRWTSGSWLENQDMIRLSGIARNTYLMARNAEDIWDFEVSTKPVSAADLNNGTPTDWTFTLKTAVRDFSDQTRTSGASKPVFYKLYDAEGHVVAQGSETAAYRYVNFVTSSGVTGANHVTTDVLPFGGGVRYTATPGVTDSTNISLAIPEFTATLANPRLWSAEDPYLYKLVMYVDNGADTEYTCVRVGFRYVQYVNATNSQTLSNGVYTASAGSYWLVNGKRLTFYGTNVHEINPETGYAMTLSLIRTDETLMKRNNVNAIRMSHYPHDPRYYDVADELGLYVMDEANHESHGSTSSSNLAIFLPTIRDRSLNMFERDKNMTCVVAWSAGNEAAMNANQAPYSIWTIKARENELNGLIGSGGRPTHAQYAQSYADMWSGMYPSYSSCNSPSTAAKVLINCEYSHAMGNSLGNMDTYVAIYEGNSYSAGGFIWDWVDQSIKTPVPASSDIAGARGDHSGDGTFFAYDGDWGNASGDRDFCANGVILADRTPKPEAAEVKRLYQRLKVTANGDPAATGVGFTVRNSFMYTNANAYDMTWQLYENGTVIREGEGVLDVDPEPYAIANAKNTSKSFTQDFDAVTAKPGAEYFFNIQFRLRTATGWADKGYVVAENQLPLTTGDFAPLARPVVPMTMDEIGVTGTSGGNTGTLQITGPDGLFEYTFDKAAGTFTDMSYKGRQFATLGYEPNFYMPLTDNQFGEGSNFTAWKNIGANRAQSQTTYRVAEAYANCVEIVNTSANTAASAQNVTMTTTYKIYPTGEINVSERYVFGASASAYSNVVGGYLRLVPGMENITYFARGPEENYVDRKTGADVGLYATTVSDNYVEYITSQDTGERLDTRWAAVTDDTGFGVVMKAGQFAANNLFTGNGSGYTYNRAETAYNMANLVEFNALHYSPTQFGDARSKHPYQVYDEFGRNDAGLPTYLYVNVASRGRGADTSWGSQAIPKSCYILNVAGKTVNYNFSILPVDGFDADAAMTYAKTQRSAHRNVEDLLPVAAAAGVPAADPAYAAAAALTSSADELTATNVYNALYASIQTLHVDVADGSATAAISFDGAPPEGAALIVAFYDADKRLIGVATDAQTADIGDFVRVSVTAAVPSGAASAKAYYWGADLAPLQPAAQAPAE
jgi:beta-galactosidase